MAPNDVTGTTRKVVDDLHRHFGSEVHRGNPRLVTEETPYFYNRTNGIYQPTEDSPVWLEVEINNPDSDYPLVTGEIRVQDRDAADVIDGEEERYEEIVRQSGGDLFVAGVHPFRDSRHGYLLQLGFMRIDDGYQEGAIEQASKTAADVLENVNDSIVADIEEVYDALRHGEIDTDEFDSDDETRLRDKIDRYRN